MFSSPNINNLNSLGSYDYIRPWYADPAYALNSVMPSFIHDYTQNKYWNSSTGAGGYPFGARTSNATMVDSQGRVVWAPHQLCTRGNTFNVAWSMGSDGNSVLSGNTSPVGTPSYITTWTTASPTSGNAAGSQPVVIGAKNTLSMYLRYVNHDWVRVIFYSSNTTSNQIRCWINLQTKTLHTVAAGGTATDASATLTDEGNGWVRVVLTGVIPWFNATDGALLYATCGGDNLTTRIGNGAAVEVAAAIFEMTGAQSPQTWSDRFNTNGTARYFERYEVDWQSGITRGLRVEPTVTNIVTNSATGHTAMVSVNIALSAGVTAWTFPTALLTGGAGGSQQYAYLNSLNATSGSTYTVSCYVKRGNDRYIQFTTSANYFTAATESPYINYDFDTDTFTSGGTQLVAFSDGREILADGWVRLFVSFVATVTTSGAATIISFIDNLSALRLPSKTASGSTVYCFGMQAENHQIVTSWIPTYAATSTRNNDPLILTSIPWFNQTDGSIYVKATPTQRDSVNTRRMIQFNDGTANNRIELSRSGGSAVQNVVATGGVATFSPQTANTTTDYVKYKCIGTYSPSIRRACLNGGTIATNATPGPGTGLTNVVIGSVSGFAAGNTFCGWIEEVVYWPSSTASDAQIQAKTTL